MRGDAPDARRIADQDRRIPHIFLLAADVPGRLAHAFPPSADRNVRSASIVRAAVSPARMAAIGLLGFRISDAISPPRNVSPAPVGSATTIFSVGTKMVLPATVICAPSGPRVSTMMRPG